LFQQRHDDVLSFEILMIKAASHSLGFNDRIPGFGSEFIRIGGLHDRVSKTSAGLGENP